ncbi:MAG: methyltransferase domain-containing protein [Proteobacteria bacterium]|nr:methyltransferase domain-containing protein [Pseudomonadota bacterium]
MAPPAAVARPDPALAAVLAGAQRTAEQRARDQYRRPAESLAFWGLRPGMTVVEIGPGAEAWWTYVLAPYAARTGGRYIAGYGDLAAPNASADARKARADFLTAFSDPNLYGRVEAVNFGTTSGLDVPPASADLILVARAFHSWARQEGVTDRYMAAFARALKPGGILAVEQHRAPEGADPKAGTGYVPESYVVAAAQRAGLVLDARSELNANPRDTRDHPFGVWTLPPIRRSSQDGRTLTAEERTRFDAVGESDRMTLKFRKPG